MSEKRGFITSVGNKTIFVVTPIVKGKAALAPSLTEVVNNDFTTMFSGKDFMLSKIDKLVFILPPKPILVSTSLKLCSLPLKILFTLINTEVESVFFVSILNSSIIDSPKLSFTDKVIASFSGD